MNIISLYMFVVTQIRGESSVTAKIKGVKCYNVRNGMRGPPP